MVSKMKMVTKKGLAFIIIILLLGTGFIPKINSSSIKTIRPQVYENELQLISSGFFDPRMKIPEHCFNLSKAPLEYEYKGIKYKEEFNFPIGTFGNNYISYGPHGIDRIALYNNFFDSFGGTYKAGSLHPRCLNGTFLGIFMNDGEKNVSKLLQQYSPTDRFARDYGLQPVEKMECWSNIPIGYYRYQDSNFSAEVGLMVYSPILLYDVKNSSLPISIWMFNAYNPTSKPIEVSFLFSLENDIGWRNKVNDDSTWQRTGTYNYIQEEGDAVGVKFTYDEDIISKSHPEYLGNMTLATLKQPDVTISYVSEWDTLDDGNDLLSTFSTTGLLSNQNISDQAVEGDHIYAGALSVKVLLEPGEGKNIPFVLSTCFPVFNLSDMGGMPSQAVYEWYWTNYFNDSWDIATYALENYEGWWGGIRGWQEKLYSSGLPPEMITFMLGSLPVFVSSVFFSKEGYWFTVHAPFTTFENVDVTTYANWFLCMFYPEIVRYGTLEYCDIVDRNNGSCPCSLWNNPCALHRELDFVIRAYQAWMWNQDDNEFLQRVYRSCKKAVEYRINHRGRFQSFVDKEDGLIHNTGNDLRNDMWAMPTSSALNSMWLLSLKCMVSMAKRLHYGDDIRYFEEWFEKAQKGFIDKFWYKALKYDYFKLCERKIGFFAWGINRTKPFGFPVPVPVRDSCACMIEQIIGAWYGRLMNEDILPLEKTKTALYSIYKINRDYYNKCGWINAVMGNPPYFIDRFGTYFYNVPNKVSPASQWSFASSLLLYGLKEEAMDVANLTEKNYLYENGGVYVDTATVVLCGTNTKNRLGESLKDATIKAFIERAFLAGSIIPDPEKDWALEPFYPSRLGGLPSWSLYQAAAGFTPCVGGLKIKPRVGGDDVCYLTQFAGCKIEMNVTGTGDIIENVEINGEPYSIVVDGSVFIPLEDFIGQEKMFIHINLL